MRTKDESHQNQHRHSEREHAEWIEKLHAWRAEHRRALAKLSKLEASMLEHDAELEEHLGHIEIHEQHIERHERDIAERKTDGEEPTPELAEHHSQLDRRHRDLRARMKRMEAVHTQTIATLEDTFERLTQIRGQLHPEGKVTEVDDDARVHEASEESFPASDPPSYNPGHP